MIGLVCRIYCALCLAHSPRSGAINAAYNAMSHSRRYLALVFLVSYKEDKLIKYKDNYASKHPTQVNDYLLMTLTMYDEL